MTTIKESARVYLDGLKARNFSPQTVLDYTRILKDLDDHLQALDRHTVATVEPADLEAWAVGLHRRGLSDNVRSNRIGVVRRYFAWLKDRGELLNDPALNLQPPKHKEPLPEAPPAADVLSKLLEAMPCSTPQQVRDRTFVEVLYGGMLRMAEALTLDVSDVDLNAARIAVRKGKGGKDRIVPIPKDTVAILKKYIEARPQLLGRDITEPALFVAKGRRMKKANVTLIFRRWRSETGMKHLHPHLLRHAGAVHMLRGNADLRHIQELLGHERLDTTKIYLRLVPADLKAAYDAAFPVLRL